MNGLTHSCDTISGQSCYAFKCIMPETGASCRIQWCMRIFKDLPVLIKINELSEKSRPSSRAVINSLFHLPIDGSLYSREHSETFSPFHPHPQRIISGRGTYYGKRLLLSFLFFLLRLVPLLVFSLTSF